MKIASFIPNFLKNPIKKVLKIAADRDFKKNSLHFYKKDILKALAKSGIKKDDTVFIHSSMRNLGYIEGGAPTLIEALLEYFKDSGTIVMPAFTMDLSMVDTLSNSHYIFDPKTTLPKVGAIPTCFLKQEGVKRSIHPTHSVAAWGKHAEDITKNHITCDTNFGKGTPFGKFLDLNGKIVGLGINYAPVTYYHVYEDYNLDKFPKVYQNKPYPAKYLDHSGLQHTAEVFSHDPQFHSTRIEKSPRVEEYLRTYLELNGKSICNTFLEGKIWYIQAATLMYELDKLYQNGKTIYKV